MSDMTTCKQCGTTMTARHANGSLRTFCGSRCYGDHKRAISRQQNKDMEERAEAKRESNAANLENWMRYMRATAERQRRREAVRSA